MKCITIVHVILLSNLIRHRCVVFGQTYFMASFQTNLLSSSEPDENVWIEFLDEIPPSKQFTICHWINIKFFNNGIAAHLWSYCTVEKQDSAMKCLQMSLKEIKDTASRNLQISAEIPIKKGAGLIDWTFVPLKSYHHRTWNHLCWSLSTITGSSKFYHNGEVIGSKQVNTEDIDLAIQGSSEMYGASLIFGQEPDSFRGGFDRSQSFIGHLSEFNVWNYTLSETKIHSIATCGDIEKGNIVSWNLNNLITGGKIGIHNVPITKFWDATSFCNINYKFVIFPERVKYSKAKETCTTHGGSVAVPQSEKDNKLLLEIARKHKNSCIVGDGRVAWIGAEKVNGIWHKVSSDEHHRTYTTSQPHLNFTKFLRLSSRLNSDCAYLQKDGGWIEGEDNLCSYYLSLCTICIIYRQPVFTLKGICDHSFIEWNYYPIIDSKNQIKLYEGFKRKSTINFDEKSKKFNIFVKTGYSEKSIKVELATKNQDPIGRKKWLVNEPDCGTYHSIHPLAISICDVPSEFTCSSGNCVNIQKRCDGHKDCTDGSDEYQCSLIDMPSQYDNSEAPKTTKEDYGTDIHIGTRIIKIDSIDTINMLVAMTVELTLTWYDGRLSFSNPTNGQDNIIPYHRSKDLWTPLRSLIYENAIVGEVIHDRRDIKILPKAPNPLYTSTSIENVVFNGSYNPLILIQRMKIKYDCRFDVKKFPFDSQTCSFIMKINQQKMTSVRFISDGNTVYEGLKIVEQFSIGKIYSSFSNTDKSARFTININMKRNFINQLLRTFIPTLVVWLFGYSTLFIDMSDFSDRFMGAGTSLLVIVTLFAAIASDLPKTSYMKHIDIWFLWHNISILAIIFCHITLNRLHLYLQNVGRNEVAPFEDEEKLGWMKVLHHGNEIVIMLFPFLNVLFYAIYFHLSVY